VQVTEGSLAKTSCSELEELASSELEDSWESEEPGTSTDEELSASALDKGSVSEEPGQLPETTNLSEPVQKRSVPQTKNQEFPDRLFPEQ
jgi:hypothetical protein